MKKKRNLEMFRDSLTNFGQFSLGFFLPMAISQGSRDAGTNSKGCLFTCNSKDQMRSKHLSSPGKCVFLAFHY